MASRQLDDKKPHRKPKPRSRPVNHITAAIQSWITVYLPPLESEAQNLRNESLVNSAPKRFTIYEPLALLPTGSFTSETWASILGVCGEAACNSLWQTILQEISKTGQGVVTHLAVNEGIPLHKAGEEDENVRRSPSGLRMLFGDFGPSEGGGEHPTKSDFEDAFWVGTKQNGILQTWAPRWTMFSRGNVKEKARLLGFKRPSLAKGTEEERGESWAVDLYAGIGYFVFSYAALGMRVLCWEINPWSVEGLRRGALANKWSIKVIEGDDLQLPVSQLLAGGERVIVFLESNEKALERIGEIQETGFARNIEHVNCGFLPTSEPVWKSAWQVTKFAPEAWLHLHENVGVEDIESRRGSIQGAFETWAAASGASSRTPKVEHVERVKTFAPGVWHCVFDVCITGGSSISNNGT